MSLGGRKPTEDGCQSRLWYYSMKEHHIQNCDIATWRCDYILKHLMIYLTSSHGLFIPVLVLAVLAYQHPMVLISLGW